MRRAVHVVSAVAACGGVLLQLALTLRLSLANGRTLGGGLLFYLSFFTVLTNIFASWCLVMPLVSPRSAAGRFFAKPGVITTAASSILVVGVTYFLLLRNLWNPQGWQFVADVVLHYVTPALFLVHWWYEVSGQKLAWSTVPRTLWYPIVYVVYSLIRGAYTAWYPYYFVDVTVLGYPRALLNVAGVLAASTAVAAVLVAATRIRDGRPRANRAAR